MATVAPEREAHWVAPQLVFCFSLAGGDAFKSLSPQFFLLWQCASGWYGGQALLSKPTTASTWKTPLEKRFPAATFGKNSGLLWALGPGQCLNLGEWVLAKAQGSG